MMPDRAAIDRPLPSTHPTQRGPCPASRLPTPAQPGVSFSGSRRRPRPARKDAATHETHNALTVRPAAYHVHQRPLSDLSRAPASPAAPAQVPPLQVLALPPMRRVVYDSTH